MSLTAWCTPSSPTAPMAPPSQTSSMRLLISPDCRPSRDSHISATPGEGVISSTPPMSNTTASMVIRG
jgi:hypothetical protein